MDLMQKYSTLVVIIKDPLSQLLNQKWEKYLGAILIFLGRIMDIKKMEMAILLFSLSEMISILSNLNVWIKQMKFITVTNI